MIDTTAQRNDGTDRKKRKKEKKKRMTGLDWRQLIPLLNFFFTVLYTMTLRIVY